ncbi:MAG: tryptophan 7-halogenase [Acidobacteria bacterium]|nr:tryptophan 7-halogenase [Acidobacteriota bacterium]
MNSQRIQFTDNNTLVDYDVIVMGGGAIGLMYATWVKRFRPQTRVAVLERRAAPGHKLGESTLRPSTRALHSMGLEYPVLRRLFGNKAGLRFFHTDQSHAELHAHFDVVDIDETYQVERRVLEMALQETTRRAGVDLFTNTQVLTQQSRLDDVVKTIVCQTDRDERRELRCRLVCDATGPTSALVKHLGLYRKNMEMYDTFNYNSYYAYFRQVKEVPVEFWSYPATRHICFPGGWLWFITLNSWEATPDENLRAMVHYLLDHPTGPDETYPTREALEREFGCRSEQMVSIGFTIRDDQDQTDGLSIAERFQHYVNKFPAIKWVMDHYELVETPYEKKRTSYFAFMKMAHDAEQFAGDGWVAIGDAALFTNPLLSPGLTYGAGTAYTAAQATTRALDRGDLSRPAFAAYEQYAGELFPQNLAEIDMHYRSFNHVESFDRVLASKIFFGALNVVDSETYTEADPYIYGSLVPAWKDFVRQVVELQRRGERTERPPVQVAQDVAGVVNGFLREQLAQPGAREAELGRFFNFHNELGERTGQRAKPRGLYGVVRCPGCRQPLFYDDTLLACPHCGGPSPAREDVRCGGAVVSCATA